jgi:hypothetical protein
MVHWPSYLYIYPSWTDILAYYTDRITDVTRWLVKAWATGVWCLIPTLHGVQPTCQDLWLHSWTPGDRHIFVNAYKHAVIALGFADYGVLFEGLLFANVI